MNPAQLQRALKGADYPATKDELIEVAEGNDASEDILEELRAMDVETVDGPDEVVEALDQ